MLRMHRFRSATLRILTGFANVKDGSAGDRDEIEMLVRRNLRNPRYPTDPHERQQRLCCNK
jgi:hypothetical protein